MPLYLAAATGDTELVELLIENGAEINDVDNNGNSPLNIALFRWHIGAAKILIKKGAKVSGSTFRHDRITPLEDWINTIKHLIREGAKANALYEFLNVNWADKFDNLETDKYQIFHGEVDEGYTIDDPLRWAVATGYMEIVQLLVENGANIEEKEVYYDYPTMPLLYIALSAGHTEIARFLIERGTCVNPWATIQSDIFGILYIPLMAALGKGLSDIAGRPFIFRSIQCEPYCSC